MWSFHLPQIKLCSWSFWEWHIIIRYWGKTLELYWALFFPSPVSLISTFETHQTPGYSLLLSPCPSHRRFCLTYYNSFLPMLPLSLHPYSLYSQYNDGDHLEARVRLFYPFYSNSRMTSCLPRASIFKLPSPSTLLHLRSFADFFFERNAWAQVRVLVIDLRPSTFHLLSPAFFSVCFANREMGCAMPISDFPLSSLIFVWGKL